MILIKPNVPTSGSLAEEHFHQAYKIAHEFCKRLLELEPNDEEDFNSVLYLGGRLLYHFGMISLEDYSHEISPHQFRDLMPLVPLILFGLRGWIETSAIDFPPHKSLRHSKIERSGYQYIIETFEIFFDTRCVIHTAKNNSALNLWDRKLLDFEQHQIDHQDGHLNNIDEFMEDSQPPRHHIWWQVNQYDLSNVDEAAIKSEFKTWRI